ncbi:helix-turn-helix domain-containing protein [Cupriavidus sp. CV2]|uniref:helix-turn-helix transcriptional regulator n=1 Tax=Cupriavidus ulmosensis TaxID=3065913 RepID=UPI00296AB7C4|nr:helix-turn-helix domain-containing protein [Cupriavidus sp. CV2]MDW3688445.1 helix-turn-helix domain-containing protein [Cupriavidus sp. CV2]
MTAILTKRSGAQVAMPPPVERALRMLGQDLSAARRTRHMTQEDLAERIGTSVNTIGRMEDGHPGTALHTFLRALHILGRLDAVLKVLAPEQDALGLELARERLPKRVHGRRKSSVAVSTAAYRKRAGEGAPVLEASETKRDDPTPNRDRPTDSDDFEGF